jgi:hypothetical protein
MGTTIERKLTSEDDGIGGADAGRGSGLRGLEDRGGRRSAGACAS